MKNKKIKIWEEDFVIVKSKKNNANAFVNINDGKEITLIINKNKVNKGDIIENNDNWKLITFDMSLPFELIGFIAKVSKALADENISLLAFSGYSTDHILVKENNLDKTIKTLEKLGFRIT